MLINIDTEILNKRLGNWIQQTCEKSTSWSSRIYPENARLVHPKASLYSILYCGGLVAKLCLTLVTLWTIAHQIPLSMEFSRQGILDRVAFPFSKESSRPRDQTQVSYSAGRFFTKWASKEAQYTILIKNKSHMITSIDKKKMHLTKSTVQS